MMTRLFHKFFNSRKRNGEKSFSQSGEDLIIKYFFKVIGVKNPSYLDIGAHDPFYLSNTAIFYLNGSKGVNVEADFRLYKNLVRYRKNDVNLNIAIGETEGNIPFYLMTAPALNTTSYDEAIELEKNSSIKIESVIEVQSISINNVLEKHFHTSCPDFITIDIEGLDYQVLSSLNFDIWRPKLICVESIKFCQSGFGLKDNAIAKLLIDKGYSIYGETYLNTIYVQNEFLNI